LTTLALAIQEISLGARNFRMDRWSTGLNFANATNTTVTQIPL